MARAIACETALLNVCPEFWFKVLQSTRVIQQRNDTDQVQETRLLARPIVEEQVLKSLRLGDDRIVDLDLSLSPTPAMVLSAYIENKSDLRLNPEISERILQSDGHNSIPGSSSDEHVPEISKYEALVKLDHICSGLGVDNVRRRARKLAYLNALRSIYYEDLLWYDVVRMCGAWECPLQRQPGKRNMKDSTNGDSIRIEEDSSCGKQPRFCLDWRLEVNLINQVNGSTHDASEELLSALRERFKNLDNYSQSFVSTVKTTDHDSKVDSESADACSFTPGPLLVQKGTLGYRTLSHLVQTSNQTKERLK